MSIFELLKFEFEIYNENILSIVNNGKNIIELCSLLCNLDKQKDIKHIIVKEIEKNIKDLISELEEN